MNAEKLPHQIYDPLGIEIFAIDETFESVFNGLNGVYFRLYYKENRKPDNLKDNQKQESFFRRRKELRALKSQYRYNDWLSKRSAVDKYAIELREMVALELSQYRTLEL